MVVVVAMLMVMTVVVIYRMIKILFIGDDDYCNDGVMIVMVVLIVCFCSVIVNSVVAIHFLYIFSFKRFKFISH